MGWVVWFVESALCLVASYLVAAAVYPDRSVLDRAIAAIIVGSTMILAAIHVCGVAEVLSPWPLGLLSAGMFGVAIFFALRSLPWARALAIARSDLGAPVRLARDVWTERELAIGTLVPAALAAGICLLMVWYFRSWTWDPVWYHVPKTHFAIQEHSIRWRAMANPWTQGNPHDVEMLAVWNCIFQRDNRLDDSSQMPFLFLGAFVAAAWCRRVGATRGLSAALGATWIALPPVFLQAHSTHVDVAWNAMFATAVYYTVGKPERRDRWLCYMAWGLFLGTKYTGAFHLALMAPYLAGRAIYEVWKSPGKRLRTVVDVVVSIVAILPLAFFKFVQNAINARNPMYPFEWQIRALHMHFPGVITLGGEYGGGADNNPTFFGAPNAVRDLITSWYDNVPFYCPDVRSGGFGTVFRFLLLPCVIFVLGDLVRGRNWRRSLLPVVLFFQALMVPIPYMTRFILAAGIAALVATAIVFTDVKSRVLRAGLSVALVAFTFVGYQEGFRGFIVFPRYFAQAVNATPVERATMQIDTFLWPSRWARAREEEIAPGEVITYDESVHFMGDLFCHDYHCRVVYVPSRRDPNAFMRDVSALHPRWVGVEHGSGSEAALRRAGGEYLFVTPDSGMAMWRMPAATVRPLP